MRAVHPRPLSPPLLVALIGLFTLTGLISAAHAAGAGVLDRQLRYPKVRAAWPGVRPLLKGLFEQADAAWPPRGVFLRSYKSEAIVELWASPRGDPDGPRVKVHDFAICAPSGVLGPKVRQGDLQVPEGFYHIDRLNPGSRFHLSLGVSYPNAVDRHRAGKRPPGGAIFIHGDCVTIGCLPLTDGPMELLYMAVVLARDAGQRRVPIHMFPCRMDTLVCQIALKGLASAQPALKPFWEQLARGHALFEETHRPPRVQALKSGRYRIRPPRKS